MPTRQTPSLAVARRALVLAVAVCFVAAAVRAEQVTTLRIGGDTLYGHNGVGRHELRRIGNRARADAAMVADFVGAPPDSSVALRIHVYPSLESKGLATGYTQPVHSLSARGEVYVADEDGFDGDLTIEVATIVLRRTLGMPHSDVLERGLAALLADDWRGRGVLYWAGRLALCDDLHDVSRLADNHWLHRQSYLVTTPVAAAFVAFLIERWGRDAFVQRYTSWFPGDSDVSALSRDFGASLAMLRSAAPAAPGPRPPEGFQRGFCLAHEGYQIYNGYMSHSSDGALATLDSLGVNAVSITPFTWMRSPHRPARLPFSSGSGSENDESVIHAMLAAKRLGMTVMLKPHLWLRGSWPGEVEMQNDADWDTFFEEYFHWMRHYALMAEMVHADILCVGVELSKTTGAQAARWGKLISRLRTIYSGPMTYAANWGEEFESTSVWDYVDFAGVNCYYPLSSSEHPTDTELAAGARRALDRISAVAARCGKPVIITEVGFTSTPAPWIAPYQRPREEPVDTRAQARCYEAFFEALAGRPQLAGVYWWKWPSFPGYGGPAHAGYTPNGKPAEGVVRRWYGGLLPTVPAGRAKGD